MNAANSANDGKARNTLQAINLAKRYGEEDVIKEITFAASSGEVLGIVGPNGAGKTTLLGVLAGLTAADSGTVLWRGETLPASRRKQAMFYLPDGIWPYQDRFTRRAELLCRGLPATGCAGQHHHRFG
jgi:ABC-type multidrug transport system ATPase subunit